MNDSIKSVNIMPHKDSNFNKLDDNSKRHDLINISMSEDNIINTDSNEKIEIIELLEQIKLKNDEIVFLKNIISERDSIINSLENNIEQCNVHNKNTKNVVNSLNSELNYLTVELNKKDSLIEDFKQVISFKDEKISSLNSRLVETENNLNSVKGEIISIENEIEHKNIRINSLNELNEKLNVTLNEKSEVIDKLTNDYENKMIHLRDLLNDEIYRRDDELKNKEENYEKEIYQLNVSLEEKNKNISHLKKTISSKENFNTNLIDENNNLNKLISKKELQIQNLNEKLSKLENSTNGEAIAFKNEELSILKMNLNEKNNVINLLKEEITVLNSIIDEKNKFTKSS